LDEAGDRLRAERDENVCREEMTIVEKVSLGRALEELERPEAKARMSEGGKKGAPGRTAERSVKVTELSRPQVRDIVGEAIGMSGVSYQRVRGVASGVIRHVGCLNGATSRRCRFASLAWFARVL